MVLDLEVHTEVKKFDALLALCQYIFSLMVFIVDNLENFQ